MQEFVKPSTKKRTRRKREYTPTSTEKPKNLDAAIKQFEEMAGRPIMDIEITVLRYKQRANTPLKSIRAHCIECCGGSASEVARCTSTMCALHPLRFGKNRYVSDRRLKDEK